MTSRTGAVAGHLLSLGLGLAALACVVWFWTSTGVPETHLLRYGLGWAWTIVVPGWALHRLAAGKPVDLLTDLGMAAGYGLVSSSIVWLLLVAIGWQAGFVFWPILPLATTLVNPRRVWTFGRFEESIHPLTVAVLGFAMAWSQGRLAQQIYATHVLPPEDNGWYFDSYWHMALVAELGRAMPPQDPQITGAPFWYHWMANAHVAAQAHVAGIEPALAFTRLWQPFIYCTFFVLMVLAARALTRQIWPGLIGVFVLAAGSGIRFSWFSLYGLSPFVMLSPSGQFVLVPIALCLIGVSQGLRRSQRRAGSLTFVVGAVGCTLAKGSALPVIICGLGLAFVVSLLLKIRARHEETQRSDEAPPPSRWWATLSAIAVAWFGFSMFLTSAANAGTQIQLFSSIRASAPWKTVLGEYPISLEPVLPGLERDGAPQLLLLVLASYVIMFGFAWLGLPVLRRSTGAWFLLGVGFAGFAAMMLVNQDGLSQVYFMSGALPAWVLLGMWGLHRAWVQARAKISRQAAVWWLILAAAVGALLADAVREFSGSIPDPEAVPGNIGTGLLMYTGLLLAALVVAALFRRNIVWLTLAGLLLGPQLPGWSRPESMWQISLFALIAVVALMAVGPLRRTLPDATAVGAIVAGLVFLSGQDVMVMTEAADDAAATAAESSTVSTAEAQASVWAKENLPRNALLATNVHCAAAPSKDHCPAKGFWVAGLTERRVLVGGWAYTPAAHEAHGVDEYSYAQQPFDDQELFLLNQEAFSHPTDELLDELKSRGVTHLFGSQRHSLFDERLDDMAEEVFTNSDVSIYELR